MRTKCIVLELANGSSAIGIRAVRECVPAVGSGEGGERVKVVKALSYRCRLAHTFIIDPTTRVAVRPLLYHTIPRPYKPHTLTRSDYSESHTEAHAIASLVGVAGSPASTRMIAALTFTNRSRAVLE